MHAFRRDVAEEMAVRQISRFAERKHRLQIKIDLIVPVRHGKGRLAPGDVELAHREEIDPARAHCGH